MSCYNIDPVSIIFVNILHRVLVKCKILSNIEPTHVKMSIEHDKKELFQFSTDKNGIS